MCVCVCVCVCVCYGGGRGVHFSFWFSSVKHFRIFTAEKGVAYLVLNMLELSLSVLVSRWTMLYVHVHRAIIIHVSQKI